MNPDDEPRVNGLVLERLFKNPHEPDVNRDVELELGPGVAARMSLPRNDLPPLRFVAWGMVNFLQFVLEGFVKYQMHKVNGKIIDIILPCVNESMQAVEAKLIHLKKGQSLPELTEDNLVQLKEQFIAIKDSGITGKDKKYYILQCGRYRFSG